MMLHQILYIFEDNSTLKSFLSLASIHFGMNMTLNLHRLSVNCIIYRTVLLLDAKLPVLYTRYLIWKSENHRSSLEITAITFVRMGKMYFLPLETLNFYKIK